jgi:excisionase family DNA binding protein
MPNLISVPEVAHRLGVSLWTIYRWAQEGRLPSLLLGRRRLFLESDLQTFISQARTASRPTHD